MNSSSTRIQGTANRASVGEAVAWIDAHLAALEAESVSLAAARRRVVARDLLATTPLPPSDRAAIDGFALCAQNSLGASIYNPLSFYLVEPAAHLPSFGAVRVGAGSPLPAGCDAVISPDCVQMSVAGCDLVEPAAPGDNVERAGSHAARGATLVTAGRRLDPYDIGVLAAAGLSQIPVIRRPNLRIVLAGHGVVPPGAPLSPGMSYDADGPLLQALIERDGGVIQAIRSVDCSQASIGAALTEPGADIILAAGGTGPGSGDHAPLALADEGELVFQGIALRPGETTCIGRTARGIPVFLLPGTPIACLWSYEFFAGRAIRRLGSQNPTLPSAQLRMTITRKIVSAIGMLEVFPVRCLDGQRAEPIASFGETGLVAASRADGFIIVPEGSEGVAPGTEVTVCLRGAAACQWAKSYE